MQGRFFSTLRDCYDQLNRITSEFNDRCQGNAKGRAVIDFSNGIGKRRRTTWKDLRAEFYRKDTVTSWIRHLLNSEMLWVVADRDVLRKQIVMKMNFFDFIEAYKQALEREYTRRQHG